MGRMLEALKQAQTPRQEPRLAPLPAEASTATAVPAAAATAEMPFIEWGPHRSMEASPSVLAAPGPSRPPRIADETAVALVAAPTPVTFRPLPAPHSVGKPAPELIAFHDPQSAESRQYRSLLDALLAARPTDDAQVLLFTAAHSGPGTTTTLLNTAITAARLGRRRVAVVDANLSKPALTRALGLREQPGLREVLAGAAVLNDALQETAQENLSALTAGLIATTGGIRFRAESMRSLVRHLRQRFDLVFVDAPAWNGSAETTSLAAACDAVFLVVPAQEADTADTDRFMQRLAEQGINLAGFIVSGG